MGDMADVFNDMKKQRRGRRRANTKKSTELLQSHNISFEPKNNGAHLIVDTVSHGKIDFWPSTGLFIIRDTGKKGRGVFDVLKLASVSDS